MTDQIETVEAFMALNPGERLRFAQKLGEAVTPEIVALLIHTFLSTEMSLRTRPVYGDEIKSLALHVDTIDLVVLAQRYVNTSRASSSMLDAHRYMSTFLVEKTRGLTMAYVRRQSGPGTATYFTGTFSRRVTPSNLKALLEAGMQPDDRVLYDKDVVQWDPGYRNGSAYMVLVPMNDDLPATLGLVPTI